MKNIHRLFLILLTASLQILGVVYAQPINDECVNAIDIGTLPAPGPCSFSSTIEYGTPVTLSSQTSVGATAANPYISLTDCEGTGTNMAAPALDVWYSFVASGGSADISITNYPNVHLALWSGTCNSLSGTGCSIDGDLSVGNLAIGSTYFIQVSGDNAAATDNDWEITVQNYVDCEGCLVSSTLTSTPSPVNGTYQPGQVVTFCLDVDYFEQTETNWFHGVQLDYGSGWSGISNIVPAASVGSTFRTWDYYPGGITSGGTGANFPEGF
jgi:hypothetical protein